MAPSLRSLYNGRNFKVAGNFLFRDPVIDRVQRIRASAWCPRLRPSSVVLLDTD
jgi:hypothetical protein